MLSFYGLTNIGESEQRLCPLLLNSKAQSWPYGQNIETAIRSRNQWIACDIESRNFDRSDEEAWSIAA